MSQYDALTIRTVENLLVGAPRNRVLHSFIVEYDGHISLSADRAGEYGYTCIGEVKNGYVSLYGDNEETGDE